MDSQVMMAAPNALENRASALRIYYMTSRRNSAGQKPQPLPEKLEPEYIAAVESRP
jgi:predicted alpha/beta-hydrolase family hydrolase